MVTENWGVKRINDLVSAIAPLQMCIESGVDPVLNVRPMGYQDHLGTTHKCLVLDGNGRVVDFTITGNLNGGDVAKNNLTATVDPVATDDSSAGYSLGSLWVNSVGIAVYVATDVTVGAAVWSGVGGGTLDQAYTAGNEITLTDSSPFKLTGPTSRYFSVTYTTGTNRVDFYFNGDQIDLIGSTVNIDGVAVTISGALSLEFEDQFTTSPIPFSQPGETALDTIKQSVIGGINEVNSLLGDAESIWTYDLEEPDATRDKFGANLIDHQASSYTPGNGATISDQAGGVVRIASDGVTPISYGSITTFTTGEPYRALGAIRGDGATGQPRVITASTILKLGTISTEWQYFVYDLGSAPTTTLLIQNMSATGYTEFKHIMNFPARSAVPVSDERHRFQWLQNLVLKSEELDDAAVWTRTQLTTVQANSGALSPIIDRTTKLPIEYQGIVADAVSTSHYIQQVIATDAVDYTWCGSFRPGTQDVILLLDLASNSRIYVDLTDGSTGGATGNFIDSKFIKIGEDVIFSMAFTGISSGSASFRIYGCASIGVPTFTGDAVNPSFYATAIQLYKGSLADNFPYVKTTTAAETGQHDFILNTETVAEYRARLGLKERVVNGAPSGIFETPVVGYEYLDGRLYKGQTVYVQAFRQDPAAGTIVLAAIEGATRVAPLFDGLDGTIEIGADCYAFSFGTSLNQVQIHGDSATNELKLFTVAGVTGIDILVPYVKDYVAVP
jgi:hypothetical protein